MPLEFRGGHGRSKAQLAAPDKRFSKPSFPSFLRVATKERPALARRPLLEANVRAIIDV